MFTTRTTKSALGLLASTCMAGCLASALFVQQANAWVEIPMPQCQEEVVKQIAELKELLKQKQAELDQHEKARAEAQKALDAADAAHEPAIDLARAVADETRTIAILNNDINHIDIVIERDGLLALPPCKPPVAMIPGTIPTSGGPLVGPPPTVDPPTNPPVEPPVRPTSGFIDPPKQVEVEPPGRWERFKGWCREFFECRTEAEEKQEHDKALKKAIDERRSQTRADQTGASRDANTTKGANNHAARTAKLEDHNATRPVTARNETSHVANATRGGAVHAPTVANGGAVRNLGATRMSGLQTAGLGGHTAGLGGMHASNLGAMHTGGMGGMRMGGMGGMHMGGMGGFARR
jgi:hypothetical protein